MSMGIDNFLSEDDKKFKRSLLFDQNIQEHMEKFAAQVYTIGYMLAESEDNLDRTKYRLDQAENSVLRTLRNSNILAKTKMTETQLLEKAHNHTTYKDAYENYLEAKKLHSKVKAKYKALLEKGEMMKSVAIYKRRELQAGIGKE